LRLLGVAAAGGMLTFNVTGLDTATAADWTVQLVPTFTTDFTTDAAAAGRAAAAALAPAAAVPCHYPEALSATQVTCRLGLFAPAEYRLAVSTGAAGVAGTLVSASAAAAAGADASTGVVGVLLGVTSVSPSAGSIGGGTLLTITGTWLARTCAGQPWGGMTWQERPALSRHEMILPCPFLHQPLLLVGGSVTQQSPAPPTAAGYGFDSSAPGANVVIIPVPTSTTFLNGWVLCDVQSATATQITCRCGSAAGLAPGVLGPCGATCRSQMAAGSCPRDLQPAASNAQPVHAAVPTACLGAAACRTRPHLAADASAEDPNALARAPIAVSPPMGCVARPWAWCGVFGTSPGMITWFILHMLWEGRSTYSLAMARPQLLPHYCGRC
jgi:hypothetical protein